MTYTQLSYEERVQIEVLKREGCGVRAIARALERSPSTISRELEEKTVRGRYIPKKAHHKTYWRRYRSKRNCMKVAMSPPLITLVHEKLARSWSPERIAGYSPIPVSKKAIYKYVKSRCLERYLFWKKHKKRSGVKRKKAEHRDLSKRTIEQRPVVYTHGHWELDFIVSRHSSAVLLVMVDRYTRFVVIRKLERKTHHLVRGALADISERYSVKTITTDNDIVFKKWHEMQDCLKTDFYFARPYHSWEKGLVENTNRWIRLFVPKRTDITFVSDAGIEAALSYLNDIPRQCLQFQTAREVLLTEQRCSS
jgi:transposase, IS30 family